MCVPNINVCVSRISLVPMEVERDSYILELELKMVVNYHVGTGNQIQVL